MSDRGLTHVALTVRDARASCEFYARYAAMKVVHERQDSETGRRVVWIGDGTRPFVIVLIEVASVDHKLDGWNHLGVGLESREAVDRLAEMARREGRLRSAPQDSGYPVGYWAMIADPDGHNLEVAFGQEVGLAVERGQLER